MFEQLNRGFGQIDSALPGSISIDVEDTDEAYVVTADLPGFEREDIEVQVENNTLTLRATREEETEEEGSNYLHRERSTSSLSRSVTLPDPVDEADASASYNNGVLTVTLPKRDRGTGGTNIPVN